MRGRVEELFDKLLSDDDDVRDWDWDDFWEFEHPSEFEALVAELWEDMGYDTEVTRAVADDGADVIATKNGLVRSGIETVVIEVKHYRGDNAVGSNVVSQLPGAEKMYDADLSVVVTSNIFTQSAEETAEKLNVELVNGKQLKQRLNQSEIEPPQLDFL